MLLNTLLDRRVSEEDNRTPRDDASGIMRGAEPRSIGPSDARKAVLMVHGFVGSPNNFNDLPDMVAEKGWHVRVMLLPGHGTSPREFESTTAAQLEEAVLRELDSLRARFPLVVLMGHSMGGALATLAAAQRPVNALILVSPYYAVTHRWYYLLHPETWAGLLRPAIRWVYRSRSVQPVNLVEAREKIVSYNWIPTKGMLTAIDIASRARDDAVAQSIAMPTLLIHSREDSVTDPRVSEEVCKRFSTQRKEVVWLERSDHIVFWDYDREEVIRAVTSFLDKIDGV